MYSHVFAIIVRSDAHNSDIPEMRAKLAIFALYKIVDGTMDSSFWVVAGS
jgi:hypothetical protein